MTAIEYLSGLDLGAVETACFALGGVGVAVALAYAGASTVRRLIRETITGLGR